MNDLSLIETREMLKELKKRHDSMLICTVTERNSIKERRTCEFSGGLITALGLAEYARNYLNIYAMNELKKEDK